MGAVLQFDPTKVTPNAGFEPVPTDWYPVKIVESELKPTRAGDGAYLELVMEILSGKFVGRKVWDRLNLQNKNQQTVEIAQGQLSAICHATGVLRQISNTQELHGLPFEARIMLIPAGPGNDGKMYDAKNEVRGYRAIQGSPTAGVAAAGVPAWANGQQPAQAQAPAQQAPAPASSATPASAPAPQPVSAAQPPPWAQK